MYAIRSYYGREMGFEDAGQQGRRNGRAIVANNDFELGGQTAAADPDARLTLLLQGIAGILDDVDPHLYPLRLV